MYAMLYQFFSMTLQNQILSAVTRFSQTNDYFTSRLIQCWKRNILVVQKGNVSKIANGITSSVVSE